MPAAAAISSTVVASNPRTANRANAVCSSSAREVTRRRPGPAIPRAGGGPAVGRVSAVTVTGITVLAR